MVRRNWKLVAGTAGAVAALMAGGLGVASAKQPQNITLTMWTHDHEYAIFFAQEEKTWAKRYPQYHITFKADVFPSGDFWNKELTAMASGSQLPNFLDLEISHFSMFMKPGLLSKNVLDLTPLMGKSISQFTKLTPYMFQGQLYALESALSPVGYYYQPAIFAKYGIKTPIKTWAEFYQDGLKLAKHGIAMAPAASGDASALFQNLLYEDGGAYFNSKGDVTVNSPQAVQALDYVIRGIKNGVFKYMSSNSFWGSTVYQYYQKGQIAGVVAPDWYATAELQSSDGQQSGKWRLMPMPRWPGSPYTTATWGGTGFAVAKNTPNANLAWSLLKYAYATEQGQVQRFETISYFPNMIPAMHDPRVLNYASPYFGGQKLGQIWAQVSRHVPEFYQSALENEFLTYLGNNLTAAYTGKMSAQQALAQTTEQIQQASSGY